MSEIVNGVAKCLPCLSGAICNGITLDKCMLGTKIDTSSKRKCLSCIPNYLCVGDET